MKKTMTLILIMALGMAVQVVHANFTFGEPTNLGPAINGPGADCAPCRSPDGLELYFHREEPDGEIRVARRVTGRVTTESGWGPSSNLGPTVNSPSYDGAPWISADGLSLYFGSERPGGYGQADVWIARRATIEDNWGTPTNLGPPLNSAFDQFDVSISADGLELYFSSNQPGGYGSYDLWTTSRATLNDNWSTPVNLGSTLNSSVWDNWPGISPDGLLIFFGSNRPGGVGDWDLYVARRATRKDPWDSPMNLGPTVNSTTWETGPRVSPDGSVLYFHSPRPGGMGSADVWQVPIIPIVDLNGDGIVDAADMCIIVDHWGTDDSLCDIGPMPWGDGIVDVQDLIVLAEHLFEEFTPIQ